jgi:hypothetical protein
VVFYDKQKKSSCVNTFVDKRKLELKPTEYFKHQKDAYKFPPYDPLTRELKVLSKDSIIVVSTYR